MARYRVALIGLGRIASTIGDEIEGDPGFLLPYGHMASYREVPEVEVVAGADPYVEQREAFQQRWGVDRLYADYHEMLERERPDIVSVATPARARCPIVLDCALAGVRALWAEKPMAFSLAEADAMIDACAANGVVVAIGCHRRWDVFWNRMREMTHDGSIGRPLQVNAFLRGGISEPGVHIIDLVLYQAGGSVQWVFGEMANDERAATDDDLEGNGYLAFDNGVRAFVRIWGAAAAELDVEVVGETGRLRSVARERDFEWWQLQSIEGRREPVQRVFPRPHRIHSAGVGLVRDLIQCIETGKKPNCSGEDGRAALEVAIAMRESHRHGGRRINLPLEDRSLQIRSNESLRGELPRALQRARDAAAQRAAT
jgi:predicted dehydrogenase